MTAWPQIGLLTFRIMTRHIIEFESPMHAARAFGAAERNFCAWNLCGALSFSAAYAPRIRPENPISLFRDRTLTTQA